MNVVLGFIVAIILNKVWHMIVRRDTPGFQRKALEWIACFAIGMYLVGSI